MMKQRVEYIDALRGLCIMWVVWYHSVHPDWVGYPFRLPVLFFVSGIFFKEYSKPKESNKQNFFNSLRL